jgi:hypothetical protein
LLVLILALVLGVIVGSRRPSGTREGGLSSGGRSVDRRERGLAWKVKSVKCESSLEISLWNSVQPSEKTGCHFGEVGRTIHEVRFKLSLPSEGKMTACLLGTSEASSRQDKVRYQEQTREVVWLKPHKERYSVCVHMFPCTLDFFYGTA